MSTDHLLQYIPLLVVLTLITVTNKKVKFLHTLLGVVVVSAVTAFTIGDVFSWTAGIALSFLVLCIPGASRAGKASLASFIACLVLSPNLAATFLAMLCAFIPVFVFPYRKSVNEYRKETGLGFLGALTVIVFTNSATREKSRVGGEDVSVNSYANAIWLLIGFTAALIHSVW